MEKSTDILTSIYFTEIYLLTHYTKGQWVYQLFGKMQKRKLKPFIRKFLFQIQHIYINFWNRIKAFTNAQLMKQLYKSFRPYRKLKINRKWKISNTNLQLVRKSEGTCVQACFTAISRVFWKVYQKSHTQIPRGARYTALY